MFFEHEEGIEMNKEELINGLNDKQKEAVLATDGPCLVIAGAGSGKTKVLTHKIAYDIESGIKPWNILERENRKTYWRRGKRFMDGNIPLYLCAYFKKIYR